MHTMLAMMTKVPELMMSEMEAKTLATSIANVSRHYDVGATQKTMDWANLAFVGASIYGTRFLAVRQNRINARADRARTVGPEPMTTPNTTPAPDITSMPG